MRKFFAEAAEILDSVLRKDAYVSRELSANTPPMVERLVLGALENDVKSSYIISRLAEKRPKPVVTALLKVGIYALLEIDNVPDYAIVSECVEAAEILGKKDARGFVNAVLKKVARREYALPQKGEPDYLAVHYSKPDWFIKLLFARYGESLATTILETPAPDTVHVRANLRMGTIDTVRSVLDAHATEYQISEAGGLIMRPTPEIKEMFREGMVTYQSPSSMLAVQALAPRDGDRVLDACSAPGGKAVYISELCPHSEVVACDVHSHRVELVRAYAERMKANNVTAVEKDATVFDESFAEAFDSVLVDAPCSCLGTFRRHPDVLLRRGADSVKEIAALQRDILSVVVRYLKKGGVLIYSTCTVTEEENEQNADFIERELELKPEVLPIARKNDGRLSLPSRDEWDGFFIARFRK